MKSPSRTSVLRRASPMRALLGRPVTKSWTKPSLQQLSPIFRLPNELLVLILEFVHDVELYQEVWLTFSQWLHKSLVCRLWREVIQKSPTLWGCIRIFNYRQAEVMIERSGDAMIDVMSYLTSTGKSSTRTDIMLSRLISDNLHRMRTLQLRGPAVHRVLNNAHSSPASHLLTNLTLDIRGTWPTWPGSATEMLFSNVNRLRALDLCGIYVQPSSLLFNAHLTFLALDRDKVMVPGAYTIEEMIVVLQRTPMLRQLFLRYWITDSSPGDANDIAHLPSLRTLEFSGKTLLQCALFTQRLSFPESAIVKLDCSCDNLSQAVAPLSSFPTLPYGVLNPSPFACFSVTCDGSEFSIHGSYNIIDPLHPYFWTGGILALTFKVVDRSYNIDAVLRLLGLFDLHSVTYLSFYIGRSGAQQIEWSPVIPLFDAAETVILYGYSWLDIVRRLATSVPPPGELAGTQFSNGTQGLRLVCLALRRLHLHCPQRPPGWTGSGRVDPFFFESLAYMLESRKASGVPVDVKLVDEWFEVAELRDLKALKRKAVWKYVTKQ